jgi:hypothetical protein
MLAQKNNDGNNALMCAVTCRNPEMVKALINGEGIDTETRHTMLTQPYQSGNNALMYAVKYGHFEMVNTLLEAADDATRNAMLIQTNNFGNNALAMCTAEGGNHEMLPVIVMDKGPTGWLRISLITFMVSFSVFAAFRLHKGKNIFPGQIGIKMTSLISGAAVTSPDDTLDTAEKGILFLTLTSLSAVVPLTALLTGISLPIQLVAYILAPLIVLSILKLAASTPTSTPTQDASESGSFTQHAPPAQPTIPPGNNEQTTAEYPMQNTRGFVV